jgi:formate hydrogenlyase subunit 3/multisubunit Na+/H+ antiporter MnhD subunit
MPTNPYESPKATDESEPDPAQTTNVAKRIGRGFVIALCVFLLSMGLGMLGISVQFSPYFDSLHILHVALLDSAISLSMVAAIGGVVLGLLSWTNERRIRPAAFFYLFWLAMHCVMLCRVFFDSLLH